MAIALHLLDAEVEDVRAIWRDGDAASLSDAELVRVNDHLGRLRRMIDSDQARLAAEIARRSRPELGRESLAKAQGFRNPTALIASTNGTSTAEAARLVKVGEAIAPRQLLSGEKAPARHPHVAEALDHAALTERAAGAIITVLDRVALQAGREETDAAEQTLVAQAAGLTFDQLARLLVRAEAWLNPDGIAPREDEARSGRSLTMRESHGMLELTARLPIDSGAAVKVAIEALVAAEMRATRDALADGAADPDVPRRSVVQMQAEALVRVCEHALGCDRTDLPLHGATVVVRIDHADLVSGAGWATIDGATAPVSVATARRMAAGGQVISCVFGASSEILDWGRSRRLFSTAQRLALVERDGGCAMCAAPPGHTKVHHIRWWARDAGPTNLANGVLLCESCHHRIHDNGWDIRIEGIGVRAKVWFVPPAYVDPSRTPRLGGRARYDYAA